MLWFKKNFLITLSYPMRREIDRIFICTPCTVFLKYTEYSSVHPVPSSSTRQNTQLYTLYRLPQIGPRFGSNHNCLLINRCDKTLRNNECMNIRGVHNFQVFHNKYCIFMQGLAIWKWTRLLEHVVNMVQKNYEKI